jgi:hypothetical protein
LKTADSHRYERITESRSSVFICGSVFRLRIFFQRICYITTFSRSKSFPRIRFYDCPGVQKLYFRTAASPGYPVQKYSFCTPPETFRSTDITYLSVVIVREIQKGTFPPVTPFWRGNEINEMNIQDMKRPDLHSRANRGKR